MEENNYPKFINNNPKGIDSYEGGSAKRVADAIKNHIKNYNQKSQIPKIIGLDGPWGSGKSNIIKMIKDGLIDDYYVFEYDAWGHQEDLQRRSFIETLTNELVEEKLLVGKTNVKMKHGAEKTVEWNEKLKYLLARKHETETTSYPKISYGILVSFLTIILLPISNFISSFFASKIILSAFIKASPVILAFALWIIKALKNSNYWKLDFLLAIYQDKVTEDTKYETISEDEPSVSDFKNWMGDVSKSLHGKKLIIVYDNMDRLPNEKVKDLWSSIHTFFADDNGFENIWVIIPYDKKHLANAFSETNNNDTDEIICHFINKTFPVIYRVSPPVITDWKDLFFKFFDMAFGDNEDDNKETIKRIYGVLKPNTTPREIISFINELVSLKQIWHDKISLVSMSVFVLNKKNIIDNPVFSILQGSYLSQIDKIISNDEILQEEISSLFYGVDKEIAKQIPLMQFLKEILNGRKDSDINEFSNDSHFTEILDTIIKENEVTNIVNSAKVLSKLDDKIQITTQWNHLSNIYKNINIDKIVFEDTHKILIAKTDIRHATQLIKSLCDKYSIVEFKGKDYYIAMDKLNNSAKERDIKIEVFLKEINVSPIEFIAYVTEAREKYMDFKVSCDNENLNSHISELLVTGSQKMDFLSYLIKDNAYSFEFTKKTIESIIYEERLTANNFPELIKTYKIISKKKPLDFAVSTTQITSLINSITDKNSEAYYDLVAMELINQLIDTAYEETLANKVSERLEYYKAYGQLLILSKDWGSELLRKSVKIVVEKSKGMILSIETILPFFNEIIKALDITDDVLLKDLNRWHTLTDKITVENIDTIIPEYSFYESSSKIQNELTKFLNEKAIEKLKSITDIELNTNKSKPSYYWFNCLSILIQNNVVKTVPDNFVEFSKSIIREIANGTFSIPIENSPLGIIISKVTNSKLQSTIKSICDDFCNDKLNITPAQFIYFTEKFNFLQKMEARFGDITRNIIASVITDETCLKIILENSEFYIDMINKSGDDAEDLKVTIKQMIDINSNKSLKQFALSIGIEIEE